MFKRLKRAFLYFRALFALLTQRVLINFITRRRRESKDSEQIFWILFETGLPIKKIEILFLAVEIQFSLINFIKAHPVVVLAPFFSFAGFFIGIFLQIIKTLTAGFRELTGFVWFIISHIGTAFKELIIDTLKFIFSPFVWIYFKIKSSRPILTAEELGEREFGYLPGRIKFADVISLAIRMFRTRRLRTSLTILGMSIGIGTILFLVSLGYGLQNLLFEKIAGGETLLTLDVFPSEQKLIPLNQEAINKIKTIRDVESTNPLAAINSQIVFNDFLANVTVYAVGANYLTLGDIRPIAGENFKEEEKNKVVVSSSLVNLFNFSKPEEILDKEVKFSFFIAEGEKEIEVVEREEIYKISGVIVENQENVVYLPFEAIADLNIQNFSQTKIKVKNEADLESVRSEITNLGFFVSAVSDILSQAIKIFRVVQIVLGIFGLVALIVSAIGMFNTMTIALLERTQEIGIMKALGATSRDIWLIFLFEAIVMATAGGIFGIIIGLAGSEIFNFGLNILARTVGAQPVYIFQSPPWFVATIALFSIFVGFATGLWPAYRASKLNILAALRYK